MAIFNSYVSNTSEITVSWLNNHFRMYHKQKHIDYRRMEFFQQNAVLPSQNGVFYVVRQWN